MHGVNPRASFCLSLVSVSTAEAVAGGQSHRKEVHDVQDYELMYVLTPELDEAGVEEANTRVTTMLAARGGEVSGVEPWGRRRLAYPIENHLEGVYSVVRLKLDPTSITAIERDFRLNESVIRHLLIRPVA
jgi:small subunit ribosomal protein S6